MAMFPCNIGSSGGTSGITYKCVARAQSTSGRVLTFTVPKTSNVVYMIADDLSVGNVVAQGIWIYNLLMFDSLGNFSYIGKNTITRSGSTITVSGNVSASAYYSLCEQQ